MPIMVSGPVKALLLNNLIFALIYSIEQSEGLNLLSSVHRKVRSY